MATTVSVPDVDVFTAIRAWLTTAVPPVTEIIRAQVNRVPEPASADFILMTQILKTPLWMLGSDEYLDLFPSGPGTVVVTRPYQMDIQLDVHGPLSGETASVVEALWVDMVATTFFDASGIDAMPLFASPASQTPFTNAESQWETRWVVTLSLQVNQSVTVTQDFFDKVDIGLIDVDAVYPP